MKQTAGKDPNKPMFVYYGFETCPYCIYLNQHTLSFEALRARYAKAFAAFPENKARLVSRMAVGNTVIDHEDVSRGPGKEQFEIIAIYTVKDGLIARVDFAK